MSLRLLSVMAVFLALSACTNLLPPPPHEYPFCCGSSDGGSASDDSEGSES